MRRTKGFEWLRGKGGEIIGANLGSDFCAEHEWGIDRIKTILGINNSSAYGLDRRRATIPNPNCILLKEEEGSLNLIVDSEWQIKNYLDKSQDLYQERKFYNEPIVAAWSEGGFIIRVKGEKEYKNLRKIHESLLRKEVAVWVGGGKFISNGGLCLVIIDKVSPEDKDSMEKSDKKIESLNIAAENTGIKKRIDDLNEKLRSDYTSPFDYFALSPRWASKEHKTKHPVVFWLNPRHQDIHDYGIFTVEQLEQWIQNKGPIIKKK